MINIIPFLIQIAQIAQPLPQSGINWTLVISVSAVCLTAMTAAINIFKSKKSINDDELRESNLIKDISENGKANSKKSEEIKEFASNLRTEVEKIKVEMLNTNKSLEDLKKDNKDLVQRLDELLRNLMDLIGN
jgi:hypothetical protein